MQYRVCKLSGQLPKAKKYGEVWVDMYEKTGRDPFDCVLEVFDTLEEARKYVSGLEKSQALDQGNVWAITDYAIEEYDEEYECSTGWEFRPWYVDDKSELITF